MIKKMSVIFISVLYLALAGCVSGKNITDNATSLVCIPTSFEKVAGQSFFGYYSMTYCKMGSDDVLGEVKYFEYNDYGVIKNLPAGDYYLKDIYFNYKKGSSEKRKMTQTKTAFNVKDYSVSFPAIEFITYQKTDGNMNFKWKTATGEQQKKIIEQLEEDPAFYDKWSIGSLGFVKGKDGKYLEIVYKK